MGKPDPSVVRPEPESIHPKHGDPNSSGGGNQKIGDVGRKSNGWVVSTFQWYFCCVVGPASPRTKVNNRVITQRPHLNQADQNVTSPETRLGSFRDTTHHV
ncbi:unnamed protein product [Macrosiphum euphorbiae]|uniref:Uncharacterized protein n=1 Tax=Macrosiphum euphorbiae TaxID=13131 RepID=A0AAV0WPA9_9HEMI|nr:unnamed protein product [Macrosiphum euphorbiae]